MWGAAYVIHGGCSDDGFEYFRRWLISRGRKAYEAALADPDSLAQLDVRPGPNGVWEFERIYYVAMKVFNKKGEGDVREHSEAEAGMGGPGPSGQALREDEEHLARRYPSSGSASGQHRSAEALVLQGRNVWLTLWPFGRRFDWTNAP